MKTSIIILTLNQLPLTIQCLESIKRGTPEEHEIIIVDNASKDGTADYLKSHYPEIRLIENAENLGFAKGCNQGIEVADGNQILFLNNDTVVPPGWLAPMLRALHSDHAVGMSGPVTNYISGHQCVPVTYSELKDMEGFAKEYCEAKRGSVQEVRRLIGFCLLVKRSVLDEIGWFDERYGLGNYEDDDLCLRAIQQGYKLLIAEDSFIHHIGHASMGQNPSFDLSTLLKQNANRAFQKWGAKIHSLIYAPPISLCVGIISSGNEAALEDTLASFTDLAEQIIVVNRSGNERIAETAARYNRQVYSVKGELSVQLCREWISRMSTEPYILWLQEGDYLTADERRRFTGLKLSLFHQYQVVSLRAADGARYMTRQTGERIFPEEIEQPRLSTFFGYASAVTISNRLEKAGMNASAAVSSEA
ncbi:glycosyltransferase [Paenibacillus sp. LMG 31459]|jgi:GT2 family glycosyltransferase|uniref:Glycosyltransferase n=1 Tax=Paenibacillus phytohabitans TaxID=2654978 RepID=A0ABX1YKH8_9BACL|nr:glycosyltransferase family 2 protein [Paenibacillus phytohabitans]NOU81555.1 glycosyltransferase [Paenibacillus phytohabitans]